VRTERGLDRLITFLDAVVAIAITLLVLPLVELLSGEGPHHGVAELYSSNAARFGAFLLSYVVIARLWWAHHRLMERVGAYDRAFVMINLTWALTIVFLPFATQVAADYGARERLAVATYIGTVTASSACLSALVLLVDHRPGLRREDVGPRDASPVLAVVSTVLLLVGLVLGVAIPAVNYWAMILLFLSGPLELLLERRSADGVG
jgi:uncharacterized membrane protein